jgi:hypothetical protein
MTDHNPQSDGTGEVPDLMAKLKDSLQARIGGVRIARLGTCSKCDDHNYPCVCRQGCDCAFHHMRRGLDARA